MHSGKRTVLARRLCCHILQDLGQKLCAPVFRLVCLFQTMVSMLRAQIWKIKQKHASQNSWRPSLQRINLIALTNMKTARLKHDYRSSLHSVPTAGFKSGSGAEAVPSDASSRSRLHQPESHAPPGEHPRKTSEGNSPDPSRFCRRHQPVAKHRQPSNVGRRNPGLSLRACCAGCNLSASARRAILCSVAHTDRMPVSSDTMS